MPHKDYIYGIMKAVDDLATIIYEKDHLDVNKEILYQIELDTMKDLIKRKIDELEAINK